MKKRLWTQGKKTTIIGLIVLAVAIYALFAKLITGGEFASILPFVLLLFRVKDTVLSSFGGPASYDKSAVVLIALSLATLSGCSYEKQLAKWATRIPAKIVVKDSTVTIHTKTTKDRIVKVPGDSSSIQALIKCDSAGNAYVSEILQLKTQNGMLLLKIKDNKLYVSNVTNDKTVTAQDTHTTDSNSHVNTSSEVKAAEVNKLTKWQLYRIYFANIIIGLIGLWLAFQIYKLIKKFK
jgi:hypothetical protein